MNDQYKNLEERINTLSEVTKKEIEIASRSKIGETYYKTLVDSMNYTLDAGGKMIRSYLVYEFCSASEESDTHSDGCEKYAAAVEMMHSFSLIHDDLPCMDNASLRRGKTTNHLVFGEATALLAGDALAILALHTCASNRLYSPKQNCEAVECLSHYAGRDGMIGGQQLDLDGEKKLLSKEQLDLMNSMKTGSLMAAACELGCIAGMARTARRVGAKGYGFLLGRAFQVTDDILDVESSPELLGKDIGADSENNKSTYVTLLGLEGARGFAKELTEGAKKCLEAFPDSQSKRNLLLLADYLLERKK